MSADAKPDGDRSGRRPGKDRREARPARGGSAGKGGGPGKRKVTARFLASLALVRLEETPSALVPDMLTMIEAEQQLSSRELRFLQELVYGVLKHRLTLDCVISAFLDARISSLHPYTLQALRLGVYQLLFLDGVPPFAAISESVNLIGNRFKGDKSLVNGLLRSLTRESNKVEEGFDRGGASLRKRLNLPHGKVVFFSRSIFTAPEENRAEFLGQVYSLPPWLVERWLGRYDAAVVEGALTAANQRPRVSARYNRLRTDRDGLLRRLATEGVVARPGLREEALLIDVGPAEVARTSAFKEGLLYLQDESAMKVAAALEPKSGERVLDLCSAPGGKATHVAELTANGAEIVAVDHDERRAARILENCERLGIRGVTTRTLNLLHEKEAHDLPEELQKPFDGVIVDAPCSNTGVLARRPEVRWRVSMEAIQNLAEQGGKLLTRALAMTGPGGRLIYSTCSLEPEENSELVQRVLATNPKAHLVREEETFPTPGGPDGSYFAVVSVDG